MNAIICARCGVDAPRRGNVQKYCLDCSEEKSKEFKARYAAKRIPRDPENTKRNGRVQKSRLRSNGAAISLVSARNSISGGDLHVAHPGWMVKFDFPFSQAASKNYIHGMNPSGGHVFKRAQSKEYEAALALKVQSLLRGHKVYQNKIWLEFFVQKPNAKSDAINIIELVCDAIKAGVGVDDRWFCIRQLDWEIAKNDPQIFISISQSDLFDAQACSYCGRILPFERFGRRKHTKNGIARCCTDCSRGTIPKQEAFADEIAGIALGDVPCST